MTDAISVVLPAYNEEANIEAAVRRAMAALEGAVPGYEVIVVNDGSRDRTQEIAEALVAEHHPRVRVLNHLRNQGYGAALRTGFRHANHPLVFFTDSDNQFDVAEVKDFFPLLERADIVAGFRIQRDDPLVRRALSWIYNQMVDVLFKLDVRDVDCAFKLFRREVFQQITIECDNFFVNAEILAKARHCNFRVVEKGVHHYPRTAGETTVRPSDIPRTLREIARMWRRVYFPSRHPRALQTADVDGDKVIEFKPRLG